MPTADPHSIFSQALVCHQQGILDEAEALYLQLLELLPGNAQVLGNLGLLYQAGGRPGPAADCLRRAVAQAPDNPLNHLNLGAVLEEEEPEAAQACYERALALKPDLAQAYNNLGKLLAFQGDLAGARQQLERALALAPDYPQALNNLGVLLGMVGQATEAVACFKRVLELQPPDAATLYNLAGAHATLEENEAAADCLRRLLALAPEHGPAGHLLAALTGANTAKPPSTYVEELFDRSAGSFDRHLQEQLGYRIPTVLAATLAEAVGRDRRFATAIDLGCGTGLSGQAFRPLAGQLTGVDLSRQMLSQARRKGIYDQLARADLVEYLESQPAGYDLYVATDVLIYLGDLAPLFAAVAGKAATGALFVFSIETLAGSEAGDYRLRGSGRYAQSPAYVERLASANRFRILFSREQEIRKERQRWLPGRIYLLAAG